MTPASHAPTTHPTAGARIPVAEHQRGVRELLDSVLTGPTGLQRLRMPLREAYGRRLAEDLRSQVNVPPLANSQMDGFAFKVADFEKVPEGSIARAKIGEMVAAGDAPTAFDASTAFESGEHISDAQRVHAEAESLPLVRPIMTGAHVPFGADAVIPVEETDVHAFSQVMAAADTQGEHIAGAASGQRAHELTFTLKAEHRTPQRYVRAAGSDTECGDVVAREGATLTPQLMGHLASVGISHVWVWQRPRAVVVSTGSELADPAQPEAAKDWQIFDSNSTMVAAALEDCGVDVVALLRVPDDPALLLQQVLAAAQDAEAHMVISTGGVSAGAVEPIRQVAELENTPLRLAFDKVAMQPGGPQGLGVLATTHGDVAWVALPGNPVSALLSIEMFVREACRAKARPRVRLAVCTQTGEPESSPESMLQIRRARITSESTARLIGGPGSHLLGALALSDALVLVPPGVSKVCDGDILETIVLR